jgi:hypothetical protein
VTRSRINTHRAAWLAPLFVLAAVLVPALAAASIAREPETRVWGFDFENAALVGVEGAQALESRRAYGHWYGGIASDSTVAPSSAANLAAPGSRASVGGVDAIQLSRRLTPVEMANMQRRLGIESAQIYVAGPGKGGGGGTYFLIRGSEGSVAIPRGSNVRLISHSHPAALDGGTVPLRASTPDLNVLKTLRLYGSPQRISTVVPEVGDPFRFSEQAFRLP